MGTHSPTVGCKGFWEPPSLTGTFTSRTSDASELQFGVREDGSVYALYSWARKLGQAASAGLTGGLLSLIGYTEANAFEPAIKDGIFDISCLVPAIGFLLLGLILWFWYPLHKKQVDANVAALKEKHNQE